MSVSTRNHSSALDTTTFVRGGEQLSVSRRRKKGDVNTTFGSAAFTAEESTSFYGNLVGLPPNVALRTSTLLNVESSLAAENSNWALGDGERRAPSSSTPASNLSESNVGFQLLKKSGWKEGTGLGASEQGRLDPVETQLKQDRRGIGAKLKKNKRLISDPEETRSQGDASEGVPIDKKEKALSKKARKAIAKAEREQEQALERSFYREFWPENV